MRTQKGYIIPAMLIVILLILAGLVTFSMKKAPEALAPVSEPEVMKPIPVPSPMPTEDNSDTDEMIVSTTTLETDIESEEITQ